MAKGPTKGKGAPSPQDEEAAEASLGRAMVAVRESEEHLAEGLSNVPDTAMAAAIVREEIDMQIATAKRYPREPARAMRQMISLATADTATATECIYRLPRADKAIVGPSIRLAELIAQQWGNNRVYARITAVDRREGYIEAAGVYHDLESNTMQTAAIRRRIKDSKGRVYNEDMIMVTGNAACAIAKRNAILAGVPKPIWKQAYDRCESIIKGDVATLGARRTAMLEEFGKIGVRPAHVYALMDVSGLEDIDLDKFVVLAGLYTSIKNGDATIEELLGRRGIAMPGLGDAFAPRTAAGASQTASEPKPSDDAGQTAKGPTASPSADPGAKSADPEVAHADPGESSSPASSSASPERDATESEVERVNLAQERAAVGESARDAEPDKPTPDSATDASGGSPAETSGPSEADETSDGGEQAPPEVDEALELLKETLIRADSWLVVKAGLSKFDKTVSAYGGQDSPWRIEGQRLALARTRALIDKGDVVRPTEDPMFFAIWVLEADVEEVHPTWQLLVRSPAYQKLSGELKDWIAGVAAAASGS